MPDITAHQHTTIANMVEWKVIEDNDFYMIFKAMDLYGVETNYAEIA